MDDPCRQLEPYLRPGEQLLWAGRPDPAVHLTPADVFVIPFSLLWGGFALFWTYSAAAGGAPLPFVLFGVPFVALGLYMLVGRFVYKAQRKRATAYGVTTERVLVAVGDRSLSDTPVRHQPLTVRSTRSGRHVSAVIGRSGRCRGPRTPTPVWSSSTRSPATASVCTTSPTAAVSAARWTRPDAARTAEPLRRRSTACAAVCRQVRGWCQSSRCRR